MTSNFLFTKRSGERLAPAEIKIIAKVLHEMNEPLSEHLTYRVRGTMIGGCWNYVYSPDGIYRCLSHEPKRLDKHTIVYIDEL